ncbi:hypothetical protein JYU34_005149 [Plutella xylostella]|uniref:Secreted protein n=1 Tax=Plutella xylostella TaxID=51655 RepID=A0ABQ7QW03_PLUXY|nr:hypothetical protein JYU34_005149 [Plutella xylostella]
MFTVFNLQKRCLEAYACTHSGARQCGREPRARELRWFLDTCDMTEYNCQYRRSFEPVPRTNCVHIPIKLQ